MNPKLQTLKTWIEKKHQELGPVTFWVVFFFILMTGTPIVLALLNMILVLWITLIKLGL